MSTPDTLRWWAEQFRTRTSEFYTSHVLVADLNYGADEIEKLESENSKLRELVRDMWREGAFEAGANYVTESYGLAERTRELGIEATA